MGYMSASTAARVMGTERRRLSRQELIIRRADAMAFLRGALKSNGVRQTEIARRLGISQAAVCYYLNGTNRVKQGELLVMCEMAGIGISHVLKPGVDAVLLQREGETRGGRKLRKAA